MQAGAAGAHGKLAAVSVQDGLRDVRYGGCGADPHQDSGGRRRLLQFSRDTEERIEYD